MSIMFSRSSRRARVGRNVAVCALLTCVFHVDVALAGHAPLVPEPRTILLQDGRPERVVIGARRGGYFVTEDAGASWSWLCEAGVGYDDEEVYPGALLRSGTLVVSTGFGGVASSADGCSFAAWLPSERPFIADIRVRPGQPHSVLALETRSEDASFVNQLWESTDDAATWERLGAPFAEEEKATSFALAADETIFAGTTDSAGAALWRLDKKASRASRVSLTDDAGVIPRVIGVSGSGDTARVYVVLDYEQVEGLTTRGDLALLSADGGNEFSPMLASAGDLAAAALSADGKTLALGGEVDGIQLLADADVASDDTKPVKVSELEAHALAWDANGRLYVAGHETEDGFSVGVSADGGHTFERFFALCQVQGPLECPAESSVGGLCFASGETGWDVRKEVADSHACDGAQPGGAGAGNDPAAVDEPPTNTATPTARGGCSVAASSAAPNAASLALLLAYFVRHWRRGERRRAES
jgi:hypothetical protein